MGILLCEKKIREVWRRNESVRAEMGHILRTHTHSAKLVVRIDIVYLIYKCNYSSFAVRTTSLHHQLKRHQQQQYWRHLPDCLESVPMSCLSLSFNYRKWVVEAEKRLDSIRGIVTSKRMQAWSAVFSTIHSRILLTECASESLYSVQNIAIHRIRLIFDSSNTLVYRLGPNLK